MPWLLWRYVVGAATLVLIAVAGVVTGSLIDAGVVLLAGPCLVAWLIVADRPRPGLRVYAGLLALLTVLFAWSQLRPGALAPPAVEWALVFGLVGAVVVAVAMRYQLRGAGVGLRQAAVASVTLLVMVPLMGCCLAGGKVMADEPYDYELPEALFEARGSVEELLPLPVGVDLVGRDCFNLGAHGMCNDVFIVSAAGGVSREDLITLLVAHYLDRGWPFERFDMPEGAYIFRACRPMRGIFTWSDQCLELFSHPREEPQGHPEIPDTVNVYLGG
jgi:hypothetical protein